MVVDDNDDILAVTKLMLERKGYSVHAFNDPALALRHVREDACKDCSLIISDIKMPNMTGIELGKYVKDARSDLKFVIMSSMPIRKQEWRTILPFSQNIDDFLAKPFSMEEIADVIRKYGKESKSR